MSQSKKEICKGSKGEAAHLHMHVHVCTLFHLVPSTGEAETSIEGEALKSHSVGGSQGRPKESFYLCGIIRHACVDTSARFVVGKQG